MFTRNFFHLDQLRYILSVTEFAMERLVGVSRDRNSEGVRTRVIAAKAEFQVTSVALRLDDDGIGTCHI